MTTRTAFVGTGHGYEKSEQGPCTAFEPFEILANPLGGFDDASRESRVFDRKGSPGVTYGSHALYLMRRKRDESDRDARNLYVAVHNGSGRTIWRLPACFNYLGETLEALQAMPERALYSLLWGITEALADTKRHAHEETRHEWARATIAKRVRTRRKPSVGKAWAWIEPARQEGESEESHKLRCIWAKPAGVK